MRLSTLLDQLQYLGVTLLIGCRREESFAGTLRRHRRGRQIIMQSTQGGVAAQLPPRLV